jgi:hypothetical protein
MSGEFGRRKKAKDGWQPSNNVIDGHFPVDQTGISREHQCAGTVELPVTSE